MNIPLPQDLKNIINQQFNNISNLNLLLTKYVRGWGNGWSFEREISDRGRSRKINIKFEHMENVLRVNYDKSEYNKFLKRWKVLLESINSTQITGKVQWRLVVGLGSGSVLETSMTLHHIFGVPYIPGTTLKGVVSSYYIEQYKSIEQFAMNEDQTYIKLFGNENQKGKVIFFDAFPTEFPKLEIDIMNPHYSKYYKGETPPADWLTPVPIKFLTVAKDTEFIFAFKTEEEELKKLVKELIKESLENFGIGAKTAVGYGYFKDFMEVK
jgi:CRISPR-associated protein Cmr6